MNFIDKKIVEWSMIQAAARKQYGHKFWLVFTLQNIVALSFAFALGSGPIEIIALFFVAARSLDFPVMGMWREAICAKN